MNIISMNKIREIIRLKESNLSQRQISVAVGISLGAVHNYLNKIKIASKNRLFLGE
jgi:DNA-binding CsgD family transcriptional regulator